MRKRIIALGTAAGVLGFTALASPAFAAGNDDPTGGASINATITNPITASLALSANSVALVAAGANANISPATSAPSVSTPTGNGGLITGGIQADVESDNPSGYALTLAGPAGGFQSSNGGVAFSDYDMNADVWTEGSDGVGHVTYPQTDLHLASDAADGLSASPTPATLVSPTGQSGTITNNSSGGTNPPVNNVGVDSSTGLTPDQFTLSFHIQPKSGLTPSKAYAGAMSLTYIPNP